MYICQQNWYMYIRHQTVNATLLVHYSLDILALKYFQNIGTLIIKITLTFTDPFGEKIWVYVIQSYVLFLEEKNIQSLINQCYICNHK